VIETDIVPTMMTQRTSLGGRQNNALDLKQQQDNPPSTTDLYLTSKEAARIARLHPVTLLKWAREGKVPHRRLGPRKIVFPLGQLMSWLESGYGYTSEAVRAA
jgi:excisionase family DNA binding protein